VEIDISALDSLSSSKKEVKQNVQKYFLKNGKSILLLSEGRLVNLARPMGQGHPIEIMDGSFAVQALSVEYLVKNRKTLSAGIIKVPGEVDGEVAKLLLKSQGIVLDKPTREQIDYANEYEEGT
jgi:adenosylhomocysteinase